MGSTSKALFERAQQVIPGGVNSPVRAFKSVNASPIFIEKAAGSRIYDVDGKEYVDFVLSWGPMILGHANPFVTAAIGEALKGGTSYGAPTEREVELAQLITEAFPSIDMVRMVNSGTEAVMSAIRLARGFTGRDKILKFEGCYHGHADSLLVKAGSGVATFGIPGSPGVPKALAELTITVPFNDADAFRQAVAQHGSDLAAVIIEPVAGNMGVVPPKPGYLKSIRELTSQNGIVLILDEVITGFRFHYGGYQTIADIQPDLTCLGKIIGGGLPVGAFGGRQDIMEQLAPAGNVYQAGTLSGNPLAMAAGIATLTALRESADYYELLNRKAFSLCDDMRSAFERKGLPVQINFAGSIFTLFFTDREVVDYATAAMSDTKLFARYFAGMLENGINIAPSQFEASFLSFAHTDEDFEKTLEACDRTLKSL